MFDNRSFYHLCLLHDEWEFGIAVTDKFVRENAILYQYVIISTGNDEIHSLYIISLLLLVHIRRIIAPTQKLRR